TAGCWTWARCAASITTRASTSRPTCPGWARPWWAAAATTRCWRTSATTARPPASRSRWAARSSRWSRRAPAPRWWVPTSSSSISPPTRREPLRSPGATVISARRWPATSSSADSRIPSRTRASSGPAGCWPAAGRIVSLTKCGGWICREAASGSSRWPSSSPIRSAISRDSGAVDMPNIVIVGAQWGDEAKGKLVDVLAPHVDAVVRYQGGNNAGHTVIVGREKFVFQSLPSGILRPGCRCVIGCGVVVDPASMIEEMEALVQRGVALDGNLYISKNAHLIMPYHPALDRASESQAGDRRIGTTGKGVGPAYADKAARIGIRMADLLDERLFREKLEFNIKQKNRLLREIYDEQTFTVENIRGTYMRFAGWLAPYVTDTALLLSRWIEAGRSVLFEGA